MVESPTKMKKIEQFLKGKDVIPDWSFGGLDVLQHLGKGGPEVAVAMATSGHFMGLSEMTWEVLSATPSSPNSGMSSTAARSSATGSNDNNTMDERKKASESTGASCTSGSPCPTPTLQARFNLLWETVPGRRIHETLLKNLQDEAAREKISEIIVATDPDREGELIATHVYQIMQKVFPGISIPFTRAYMHALTVEGVQKAMRERTPSFDWNLAHAAEARHAMDRIFGFLGSTVVRHAHPLMRSIGRVQTPSLILIREREEKIKEFKASHPSYYELISSCSFKSGKNKFTHTVVLQPEENSKEAGELAEHRAEKSEIQKLLDSWGLKKELKELDIWKDPQITEITTLPPDPFTMSALLTRANRLLHLSSGRSSLALQELFQHGYITYPRTDSTRVDVNALEAIYKTVAREFGEKNLQKRKIEPIQGRQRSYKGSADSNTDARNDNDPKASAEGATLFNVEDAHEAIRPTNIRVTATKLPSSLSAPAQQLYDLIRRHTLASCMIPMKTEKAQVFLKGKTVNGVPMTFKLEGRHTTCEGWSKALTAGWKKGKGKRNQGIPEDCSELASAGQEESIEDQKGKDSAALTSSSPAAMEDISDESSEESPEEKTPVVSNAEFQALLRFSQDVKLSGSGSADSSASGAGKERVRQMQVTVSSTKLRQFTPPPPLLYSEGGLIADLRKNGVGRPSTYPLILQTLEDRKYVVLNKQRCETTEIGKLLVDVSRGIFPSIVDIGFTSKFEKQLDSIAKPQAPFGESNEGATASTAPTATKIEDNSSTTSSSSSSRPLSPMDRVLSQFTSDFLYHVYEATRQQRALLAERSLHVLSSSGTMSSATEKGGSENKTSDGRPEGSANVIVSPPSATASLPPTPEVIQKEREQAMSRVPDLVQLSTQYKTFTAVQSNLREYLWRNFPRPSTTTSGVPLPSVPSTLASRKHQKGKRSVTKKKRITAKKATKALKRTSKAKNATTSK